MTAGPSDSPETLVFLHGWAASKELWGGTLAALAPTHRIIALDLPGTGGTPLPPGLTTMAQMAAWGAQTCGRLGLASVTLVGHSMGGNLAAQVALEYPSLVRRLVLVDAALEPDALPVRARWPLSPQFGLTALRLMRLASWPVAWAGRRVPFDSPGTFWQCFARRTHWYLAANADPALQVQIRALHGNPWTPARLSRLRLPTLILHGARDGIVPVSCARRLAETLPQARLVVFPNSQHCPMDSDLPAFTEALREFCTS